MKVVVLGASGEMGRAVSDVLDGDEHEVVAASRRTGVDAVTGTGVDAAFAGADVVLDCLNILTARKRTAVEFFTTTASNVVAAASRAAVPHVVLLSIVNVTDEIPRRALGYYAGKAAQEESYLGSGLPVTVVATTAWFSLAEQFLHQVALGPLSLVPTMDLQPVHPDAARDELVAAVLSGPDTARVELAGPERIRADTMARQLAAATGSRQRVVGIPFPNKAFRHGSLLPKGRVRQDPRTFAEWLTTRPRA